MKKLYIMSPSDRFNYGDMLFSYVLAHYLHDSVDEVINCSSTTSDLSELGGMPTLSYEELYKANPNDENYLIFAGGESLFTTWDAILSFIYPEVAKSKTKYSQIQNQGLGYLIFQAYYRYHFKKKYHIQSRYPFTIGLHELPNFKSIMYNSVGSAALLHRKDVIYSKECRQILKSSAYISVRDNGTSKGLSKMNISHQVCPDSAILMSEIFSDDYLNHHKSFEKLPYKKGEYIFFQINERSLKGNESYFGNLLNRVYDKTNIHYVLCPIGTALGHSDDMALERLTHYIKNDSYTYMSKPNIWDIMYLIKESRLYVGTSLHGAITAQSFSVPMVTHGKLKLKQYLTDWRGYSQPLTN